MLRGAVTAVLAALAALYIWLVWRTTRWTVEGPAGALDGPGGVVAATWHGRLFLAPAYAPPGRRSVGMVSRSRDGAFYAAVLQRWGIGAVRGSSHDRAKRRSKGGAQAFRTALDELVRKRAIVGITPDGPRGPARQVRPGAAQLAVAAQVPIVPVAFSVRWGTELRSWDRFLLPFPFGHGAIVYGAPRCPPEAGEPRSAARLSAAIEADLDAVTGRADILCGRALDGG